MSAPQRRVAVLVMVETDADDDLAAVMSVSHALALHYGRTPSAIPSPPRRDGRTWETTVHEVIEAGIAIGNGYLWALPTSKAYPREDDR